MEQQDLMLMIQSALDAQEPGHIEAVEQINLLMQESDVNLLQMCIFAAITESAPPFFKNEAALLVKNFLTCKNPEREVESVEVYQGLPIDFRNSSISQLILLLDRDPYDQIFEIISALINASPNAEQVQIIEELVKHANVNSTIHILRVFEELRNTAFTSSVPEFCVHCLENFQQVFMPDSFQQGIKLTVRVLRRCKTCIPQTLHQPINELLYLLLEQSVQSEQTEFIQEILEFYVEVVEIFDLLGFTVDEEAFIIQLLNLCFMYSSAQMQEYEMLFTILELEKKVFLLPAYKSIYQSQYPFAVVENCLLPILQNDAYYGEEMLNEIFVVMQELLDIIIQHADPSFEEEYLQYVNSMGMNSLEGGILEVIQPEEELQLLKHMLLLTPLLKSSRAPDHFLISEMEKIATYVVKHAGVLSSQLIQQSLDMISYLMDKCNSRFELFNKVVALLPDLHSDFHWRSVKNVITSFEALDNRYLEDNLTRVYSQIIKNKENIDTAAAMVLIDQVLPALEKSISTSNLFFFMSTVNTAFENIQQYFMSNLDVQEIPYLEVVTESINIPVFYIACQELELGHEESQIFHNLVTRVSDLLIYYIQENRFEIENELCQLFEILSIVQKKADYRLASTPALHQICLALVSDPEEAEITSYCLDLLVKLPEFVSGDEVERRVMDLIEAPDAPFKLQNAVLIYFMELQEAYQRELPTRVAHYIDSFLSQIDLLDLADKQQFLVLESIVLILQKAVEIFNKNHDQAVFAAFELLRGSKCRPSLQEEPQEYLFVSGYEAAINCFTCCYHFFKQNGNQYKEQMVLGYVNELGKDWTRTRDSLRQLGDMQQHLSQFECQFSAILRENQ